MIFNHASLFSGIGATELAAEWMGWNNIMHCEINPFCQTILKHYWPNAKSYADITKTDFSIHRGTIDILTGGFPCQPYSQAGKRLGKEDDRHLWPEMLRAIGEIQPRWVVGENVRGLTNWNGGLVFDEVQADLEAKGYEILPFLLPACAVNAPHRRDRIWFVAYCSSNGHESRRLNQNRSAEGESKSISDKREWIWDDGGGVGESGIITDTDSSIIGKVRGNETYFRREFKEHTDNSNISINGDVANTASEGLQKPGQTGKRKLQEKKTERMEYRFELNGSSAPDSNGFGLRGQGDGIGESGLFSKESQSNYWQNFPTQSPVCSGDDGVSSGLDFDTVFKGFKTNSRSNVGEKWRTESIRAAGNAMVPAVVLQIFKAIEAYENTLL